MPDKEKIITPENQGKGVTPTAGSKQIIIEPGSKPSFVPRPRSVKQELDANGQPKFDPIGKSGAEINSYLNSQYGNRVDATQTTDFGSNPYEDYSGLGDDAAFYQGGNWAQQASEQQGFLQQAGNAIVGGTVNGALKAIEALTYIPNILTRDWEKSALQEDLAQAQQDVNEAMPVYSDPNNPLSWDSSMFWSGTKGVIESGLQFAIPGGVISKGLGMAGKGLSMAARGIMASEGVIGAGVEAIAASSSRGVTALLEGMIANPAKRVALMDWAANVPAGVIQNQLEGTIMGFETYKNTEDELRRNGITDENYIKKIASQAADDVRFDNLAMLAKDTWEFKTIFGKASPGIQKLTDESRLLPRSWSELNIFRKEVWKDAWNGGKNPLMLSLGEMAEEMVQGGQQDNIMNKMRYAVNKDQEGNSDFTPLDVDIANKNGGLGAVLSYAFTEQNIFEGMMGFFGGGVQNAMSNIPGKIMDNKKYKTLSEELIKTNDAIEATSNEEEKQALRTKAEILKRDILNTRKGNYENQQDQVKNNNEILKTKFENLFDAQQAYDQAVFEGDDITKEAIEENMFVKAAMDNLSKGTLSNFRSTIEEIANGTKQGSNLIDTEITPEIKVKAQSLATKLIEIENEWNRHNDPQLGKRKFFVNENIKTLTTAVDKRTIKVNETKAKISKNIEAYNAAQKAVNPNHADITSDIDVLLKTKGGVPVVEFDTEKQERINELSKLKTIKPTEKTELDNLLKDKSDLEESNKRNQARAKEFINDPTLTDELVKLKDHTDRLEEALTEREYLNSAQYRSMKDKVDNFVAKNVDNITDEKVEKLIEDLDKITNSVDSKSRINDAGKDDILEQVRMLSIYANLHRIERIRAAKEKSDLKAEQDKLREKFIPFIERARAGIGYFSGSKPDGTISYAHITTIEGVEPTSTITYNTGEKTKVLTFEELQKYYMDGIFVDATKEEFDTYIDSLTVTEPEVKKTEKPGALDYSSPNNYNAYLNLQDPIGAAIGSSNPLPSPVVEWDIDPIVKQEQKRLNDDISVLIQNKIDLLKEEQNNVQSDISDINKVVKSLSAQLTSKTKLSGIEVEKIQKQIQTLLNIVNSNSKKNSKKGLSTINRAEDLKLNIRAEFKTLNELFDSIKELKKYAYQLRTIRKDLNNQVNYYNSLLNDNLITKITTQKLIDRRNKISNKISIIDKLIKILNDALSQSIKYIKSYVDSIKKSFNNLKSKDLSGLLNESLDKSQVTNYNKVTDEFNKLENNLYDHLNDLEFLEENKNKEQKRLDELQNKLTTLTNQFRYIDELINDIPIDNSPIPNIEIPITNIVEPVITEQNIIEEIPQIIIEEEKLKEIQIEENIIPPTNQVIQDETEEFDDASLVNINDVFGEEETDTTPVVTDPIVETEPEVIPEVPNQNIREEEKKLREKNKLTNPHASVSRLGREYVISDDGTLKNKSDERVITPISSHKYVVGTNVTLETEGEIGNIDHTPIRIIFEGDNTFENKSYVPTLASLLSTENAEDTDLRGLFATPDPSKSDEGNRWMILTPQGQEIVNAIMDGESKTKIANRIKIFLGDTFDTRPFNRVVIRSDEEGTEKSDFKKIADQLIKLFDFRKDILNTENPSSQVTEVKPGDVSRRVGPPIPTKKLIDDTNVEIVMVGKDKNQIATLKLPMKSSDNKTPEFTYVKLIAKPIDKELVYLYLEDFLNEGNISKNVKTDKEVLAQMNDFWAQDIKNKVNKLDVGFGKNKQRQIAVKKQGQETKLITVDNLIDGKLSDADKAIIDSYIGNAQRTSYRLNVKDKNTKITIVNNNGTIGLAPKVNKNRIIEDTETDVLYVKDPYTNRWIFHEQATFEINTQLTTDVKPQSVEVEDQPVENVSEPISNEQYNAFVDAGIVSDNVINSIANKVSLNQPLSQREILIFSDHTTQEKGSKSPVTRINEKLIELKNNISNTESQVKPDISTVEDIESRRQEKLKTELDKKAKSIPVKKEYYIDNNGNDITATTYRAGNKSFVFTESNTNAGDALEDLNIDNKIPYKTEEVTSKLEDKINAKYDDELLALNNTQTKNVPDPDSTIEEKPRKKFTPKKTNTDNNNILQSIKIDVDDINALSSKFLVSNDSGNAIPWHHQEQLVTYGTHIALEAFNADPNQSIEKILNQVEEYFLGDLIEDAQTETLKNMPQYIDQIKDLIHSKLQASGLRVKSNNKTTFNEQQEDAEIIDSTGEQGHQGERYDESIYEMNDYDRASFRLKSKLSTIEMVQKSGREIVPKYTTLGLPEYVDGENAFITIKRLLSNKPNLTFDEAIKVLRDKSNPNKLMLNQIADNIITWDNNAKNEFMTVLKLYKATAKIALWNTKDGTYSANLIDADRNSGGRVMVETWESDFFNIVNDKNNNLVIGDVDHKFLINANKIADIKSAYENIALDYKLNNNDDTIAGRLTSLLNQLKVNVKEEDMQWILDNPKDYSKIAENYFGYGIAELFDPKAGVIGVLFNNLDIPKGTAMKVEGKRDMYVPYSLYNPFSIGGNYLSNLGRFISSIRGNQSSDSFMGSNGNMQNLYSIFDQLTTTVANIRNKTLDDTNTSAFGKDSSFIGDPNFNAVLIDSIKNEDSGDFEEAKKLSEIEIELNELAGIQNNGNLKRTASSPTNSDKTRYLQVQISQLRNSIEFTRSNIVNNSIALVNGVQSEINRINAYKQYVLREQDEINKTGNTQLDNGYKFFYLLPSANIQIAKSKIKEILQGLLTPEQQENPKALKEVLSRLGAEYNNRYAVGFEQFSITRTYADVLNKPDLTHLLFLATKEGTKASQNDIKNIDEFVEAVISNNYDVDSEVVDSAIPLNDLGFITLLAADQYNQEVEAKLQFWEDNGIDIDRMDNKWLSKLNQFVQGPEDIIPDEAVLQIAAREAVSYSQNIALGFYQSIAGDPASFYKGKPNKINDLTAEQTSQVVKATITETIKRNAKNLAAGTKPNFHIKQYNEHTKRWEYTQQPTYQFATINNNIKNSINKSILAIPRLAKMYQGMDIADALEYTSFEEHLHVMFAKGESRLNDELYERLLKKAYIQDRLKDNEPVPKEAELTDSELKFVMGMHKPVQVTNVKFNDINMNYPLQAEVYIKSSSMPIIHQVFNGLEINKIKEAMFFTKEVDKNGKELRIKRETPINRVAYSSAVKSGAINIANVWKDGKVSQEGLNNIVPVELDRAGFYIQQEIPYDETKNQIRIMSQMDKLLLEGFDELDPNLRVRKEDIKKKMFAEAKAEFIKKFDINEVDGSFNDMSKVVEILKREAQDRGFTNNALEYLSLDENGKFVVPPFFTAAANKYESLMASIASKIVLQKVHGHSYVQTSSSGIKTIEGLTEKEKNDIVLVKGHSLSQDLPFITKGEKAINAAGVYVPFQFLDNKGNKLNPKDFTTTDEEGNTYLDPKRVPNELLRLIGGRIPGQGPNSMLPIQILGFLPEYMGNVIVVPQEIVVQMGSDFDVDKLYAYMWNYSYDEKNGKLRMYNQETSAKGRIKYEEYKKYKTQRDAIKEEIGAFINEYGITDNKKEILSTRESLDNVADNIRLLELVIEEYWGEELTEEDNANIQDLLGKIKSFEKDRTELIEQLNEFKDTKTTLDDYDGGKALLERKRALYTEYQNTVTERIDNLVIEKNIKTLQNEYFDIHWEALTNLGMFERIAESLDMTDLANEHQALQTNKQPDGLLSPRYNRESYLENRSGKEGVAIEANAIVLNAMIQGLGLNIGYKNNRLSIPIEFKSGQKINLNTFGLDAYSEYNGGGRRIHKNIQNIQSEAVDNAKYGRLGALNFNKDTFNAINALLMMGDDSKNKALSSKPEIGAVANDHAVALMTQPVIKRYITEKNRKFNQFNERYSRHEDSKLKDKLIEELYKAAKLESPGDNESYKDAALRQLVIPSVTALKEARDLNLNTASKEEVLNYNKVQLNSIVGFFALDEAGSLLAGIQKSIDASTRGIGKSFIDSFLKERMYNERIVKGDYTSSYFEFNMNNTSKLQNTEYGDAIEQGVKFSNKVFGTMFPYKHLLTTVTDYFANEGKPLDEKAYREIINYYKSFIFANNDIYENTVNAERERLFVGEDNIFDRVTEYKQSKFEGSYLLNGIVVDQIGNESNNHRRLRFAAGKTQRVDEANNTQSLVYMLNSKDEKVRQLGNDLITYSFITNPVQSANNFMMYMPASIITGKLVNPHLNQANIDLIDGSIQYQRFITQYIQNKPDMAAKMKTFGKGLTLIQSHKYYVNQLEGLKEINKSDDSNAIKLEKAIALTQDTKMTSVGDKIGKISRLITSYFRTKANPIFTEFGEEKEVPKFFYNTIVTEDEYGNEIENKVLYETVKEKKGYYTFKAIPTLGSFEFKEMNSSEDLLSSVVTKNNKKDKKSTNDISAINKLGLSTKQMPIQEVINNIINTGSNNHVEVAKVLKGLYNNSDYKIVIDEKIDGAGEVNHNSKLIKINPNNQNKLNPSSGLDDLTSTVIHELFHPLIDGMLALNVDQLTEKQKTAILRLHNIRLEAVDALTADEKKEFKEFMQLIIPTIKNERQAEQAKKTYQRVTKELYKSIAIKGKITGEMKAKYYGLLNNNEFITMAWSDNKFQERLNNIITNTTDSKGFIDRLVSAFNDLIASFLETFGITINNNSILAETLSNSMNLINSDYFNNGNTSGFVENKQTIDNSLGTDWTGSNNITLNPGQQEFLDKALNVWLPSDNKEFLLKGRGGSGKTFVSSEFIKQAQRQGYGIYATTISDAALSVLSKNFKKEKIEKVELYNFASMFGLTPEYLPNGTIKYIQDPFSNVYPKIFNTPKTILIFDEGSMIGPNEMQYLNKYSNIKILYMGDNAQIQPIGGSGISTIFKLTEDNNTSSELTEVIRQAKDNPILWLATILGNELDKYDKTKQFDLSNITSNRFTDFNQSTQIGVRFDNNKDNFINEAIKDFKKDPLSTIVVVGTNEEVKDFNKTIRNSVVQGNDVLVKDEKVMFYKKYADRFDTKINNSAIVTINSKPSETTIGNIEVLMSDITYIDEQGKDASARIPLVIRGSNADKILQAKLHSIGSAIGEMKRNGETKTPKYKELAAEYGKYKVIIPIEYAYAMTAHKIQGQTLKNTYVYPVSYNKWDQIEAFRMLYTSYTRPTDKLTIFNSAQIESKPGYYVQQNNTPEQTELDFNNTSESIKVNETITDGIDFVFESNPELANSVYEALGFNKKLAFVKSDNTIDDDFYIKDELIITKELQNIRTNNFDGSINIELSELKDKLNKLSIGNKFNVSEYTKPSITNLEEVLNKINLSESNKILLEKIRPLIKNIKIEYVDKFILANSGAVYSDKYNTIRINKSEKNIPLEELLMHELLHAATFRKITYFETNTKGLSEKESLALNELENIRKVLKEASDKYWNNRTRYARSVNPLEGYRTDSIHEIISYAFTNEEFRNAIAEIPYTGNKSILDKLVELIANIFGVKQNTVLNALLANAEVLLNNNQITPQQKQQAAFMFSEFLDVYLQDFEQVEKILKQEKVIDKKCN